MLRSVSRQPRWWLALLQVVLLLATFAIPAAAATDPAPLAGTELLQLLRTYGIVKGDDQGNLNLDRPIKRAEMITIMVRALGAEKDAEIYKGWSKFTDAKGHWAEGNITWAAMKGYVKGDGNDLVRPNDFITYGEALTLTLRLVGKEPTTGEWPLNIVLAAADLGLMPPGLTVGNVNDQAVRGQIFQSMATAVTTIKTANGKTFLQTYVDTTPPTVALNKLDSTTKNATVTVSGTADGASAVTVNGKAATLSGKTFSASVPLEYGENKITARAVDLAGNSASTESSITRAHPIASLEITGPNKVRPNGSGTYSIKAKNASGQAVSLTDVSSSVTGNIGTFNLSSGVFTAGNTPGKGSIVITAGTVSQSIDVEVMGQNADATQVGIRSVNDGKAVSVTKPMTVEVEVQDANGQLLDTDYGRPVTLTTSGLQGLSTSPSVAYTEAGVATFTVKGSSVGTISLLAASSKLTSGSGIAEFGTTNRIVLSADPTTLVVGGSTTTSRIRAKLVDENGNATSNNTGSDITLSISETGSAGILTDTTLRIARNSSSSSYSGDEGYFAAGSAAGTVTISGSVTSGQNITVDPVSVSVSLPQIGSGSYWDLIGNTRLTPDTPKSYSVRLTNSSGATIAGSFAFQISVSTSNNETKTNGIPEGVSIKLGDTDLTPVSDGIAESSDDDTADVIARTSGGTATLTISYDKPGEVYVTVNSVASTDSAYDEDGSAGSATNSGVASRTFTLTASGTATKVKLLADSDGLGAGYAEGATSGSASKAFTLNVQLTDADGYWVPNSTANVTLVRDSGTSTTVPSKTTVSATNGKATFTVYATPNEGEDVYHVTANLAGNPESDLVTLQVEKVKPAAPSIAAIRGIKDGVPGALAYVAPDDTDMEIELSQNTDLHWAAVKIYVYGTSKLIYTSEPVDMTDPAPRILVPKSAVPNGTNKYQVALRNGAGDSDKSLVSDQVTNSVYVSNVTISSAKYQASTKTLTINGTGFASSGDTVDPAKLTITDASTGESRTLDNADVTLSRTSQFSLNLTGLAVADDLENPDVFSGSDVTITAADGWYTRANGEQSEAITTGAKVGPLAQISSVTFDPAHTRLTINGTGFSSISLKTANLKLQADGAADIALSSFSNSRVDDSHWTVTINSAAVTALEANANFVLNGLAGWAYDGTYLQPAFNEVGVYAQTTLSSVTYDSATNLLSVRGSGFTGGEVTIGNLQLTDLSTHQTLTLAGVPTIVSDTQIDLTLGDATATTLEDGTKFKGSDVYLIGDPAWFTNAAGRDAAPVPVRTLRLPTMNQ